jgi:hypothetical protein
MRFLWQVCTLPLVADEECQRNVGVIIDNSLKLGANARTEARDAVMVFDANVASVEPYSQCLSHLLGADELENVACRPLGGFVVNQVANMWDGFQASITQDAGEGVLMLDIGNVVVFGH